MTTINISVPNDYNSEVATEAAIVDCYGGDTEAATADECRMMHEKLADAAIAAGLDFVKQTDFGIEWSGTAEQVEACHLPAWASISKPEA